MAAPLDAEQVRSRFRTVARQGVQTCEQLERGQAEMPMAAQFQALAAGVDAAPFAVILLGLTVEARGAALAWLCGQDFRVFSIHVPREVGLVEVQLQERGYVLEGGDGQRREFDRLDPFLEAVRSADLVRSGDAGSWLEPLHLRVAAPPGLQGLRVIMPENPSAIVANPAALKRLLATSNILLVAGPAAAQPSPDERAAIAELAVGMEAAQPLVVPDAATELPRSGWWTDRSLLGARLVLAPLMLPPDRAADVSPLFSNPADAFREALCLAHQGRRMQLTVEMIGDRLQDETRRMGARQAALNRKLRALEEASRDQDLRVPIEAVRTDLMDETGRLIEGIKEINQKAILPKGKMIERMREEIAQLEAADLRQEATYSAVRLTVDERFLRRVADAAKEVLKSQFREDMILLRDGFELLNQRLSAKLSELRGAPVTLELPLPDEKSIWDVLRELIGVEIRYHGEMPKRGFFHRLGEGRQKVFMILMFFTLFGGVFGLSRTAKWVGWLMIGLFIGGVIYTFFSWRHEDREKMEKELERVKEALQDEVKRLFGETQREKIARILAHAETLKKEALRRLDEVARETQRARLESVEADKQEQRRRQRILEQQSRDLQGHLQRVSQLRQAAGEVETMARSLLATPEARRA